MRVFSLSFVVASCVTLGIGWTGVSTAHAADSTTIVTAHQNLADNNPTRVAVECPAQYPDLQAVDDPSTDIPGVQLSPEPGFQVSSVKPLVNNDLVIGASAQVTYTGGLGLNAPWLGMSITCGPASGGMSAEAEITTVDDSNAGWPLDEGTATIEGFGFERGFDRVLIDANKPITAKVIDDSHMQVTYPATTTPGAVRITIQNQDGINGLGSVTVTRQLDVNPTADIQLAGDTPTAFKLVCPAGFYIDKNVPARGDQYAMTGMTALDTYDTHLTEPVKYISSPDDNGTLRVIGGQGQLIDSDLWNRDETIGIYCTNDTTQSLGG